ncbi:hypothetical protein AAE02nite_07210 [Adhaeribacter aerolatus]|uniref:Uncharacterized protein n=1 Tax=Adhaeribacter aerolatus TaxID=670289 RepID=A0A512AU02_9BACT|nr:PD40 domain-containing protein [Adhaeribacter aerolatus]GEO03057.1 hypothetical protein AAE02nite_07210 [Adhaeribacter aerolatus]
MKQNYKFMILLLLISLIGSEGMAKPIKKTSLQEAEAAYAQRNLTQAEALYLQVLKQTPNHYLSNARLGSLYLGLNQPAKSIEYLKKAIEVNKKYGQDLNQQLALAYQLAADYDNAITIYYDLLKREKKNSTQVGVYQKKINECVSGKQLMAAPLKVKVNNMGALVNSASVDHVPVLTANDNTILFTSQRSKDLRKPKATADEDIFMINRQEENWSSPTRLQEPFNTPGHEAILAVAAEGSKMYLYSNKKGKGDIYESQKVNNNVWQAPVKLDGNINTRHHELSFIVSADGNFAFFSSDRPGGYGGLDLYMSISEGNGKWSEAINLGPNINTAYDEDAPFLSSDNNVIYFSSKGHNTIGGYDIFKSNINGTVWSLAQNMGVPVNSPYDDAFYVQTQDGKTAYFSSDRPGGFGESDIYVVEKEEIILAAEPEEMIGPYTAMVGDDDLEAIMPSLTKAQQDLLNKTRKLKGYVVDAKTNDTIFARITLLDKTLFNTDVVLETTPEGYFELELENDKSYGLLIESDGYQVRSEDLAKLEDTGERELNMMTTLRRDSVASSIALQNIQFYPNHDYIKSYSVAELDWLYTYLLDNPQVDAVITDYQNAEDTLQDKRKLTQQRAGSVIKYLNAKGLEPGRVKYKPIYSKNLPDNNTVMGMVINLEATEAE